ncbi:mobilization protein, partial [Streptomyces sp. OF8]|nr:mobilization protein [Streptomyces alkaliterrae]
PWHHATALTEQLPHHLHHADDSTAQAHIAALGETLDALPLITPGPLRTELRQAATAFERATRSRARAEHHNSRALRSAVRAIVRQPPQDNTALAMLLDAALLAVIATAHWHKLHHHDQQVAAAQQALAHLQTAYDQAVQAPLAALAQHRPPQHTVERHIRHVQEVVPHHAERVVADSAFHALTATLAAAEAAGHNPQQLLGQATDQRALDDARHPARVLVWRIERLSAGPVPNSRVLAARSRSTRRPLGSSTPAPQAATPATLPSPKARRR